MNEVQPKDPRRSRLGWILTGIGVLLILAGVLELTSAGYGTHVLRDFSERRSYDMVKRDLHHALPRAALTAALGGGFLFAGSRARVRPRARA
jgi:hypothetical protein